jgi:integrase
LPELQAYNNVIQFAQERGAWPANKEGSLPPWLWCIIEICYLCRLRGIEAVTLTDANETERGIATNRRKGSRDNVVMWSPRLTAAWDAAKFVRQQTRTRKKLPTSTRAEDRWIFLNGDNMHIRRDAVSKVMKRLMDLAIEAEVITEEQRFTLHPVKRRGTTDTKGNRADKQTATGHKSAAMLDIYDMELPEVQPSGSS